MGNADKALKLFFPANETKNGSANRDEDGIRLLGLLHRYARENLLLANIYVKDPAVTIIKRDQKIPVIWFVANLGGIMGLCMGGSLVTLFEVAHHLILGFYKSSITIRYLKSNT